VFQNILVCLDGSKLAEQILPFVEAQALQFKSKITLLQVIPLPNINIVEAGSTYNNGPLQDEQTQINFHQALNHLEALGHFLQEKGVKSESAIIKSSQVGKTILEYAQENNIDLISIATHGHSGLGKLVFSSVADYILRESGLPMLVIKPQKIQSDPH
jgi:nucleotide-binding universal stress UspA family protein